MADYVVSQITLLDGKTVEIKDAVARAAIIGGTYFLGVTTTALTDGSTTNPITINEQSVTAVNGNQVVYGNKEFVWASADSKWHEMGDLTGLGDLALKDSASGSYTPEGTVEFTGGTVTSTGTYTPAGSVSFTGGTVASTGTYTPAGSVSFTGGTVESTGTYTPAGSVSFTGGTVSSSGTYTPAGSVSKPDVDVTPTTATIAEFDSAGSVTAGVAASATLPTWSATVVGENLTFAWNQGAFTPNTPTSVTLPTSKNTSVVTGVSAELHAAPSFTGTEDTIAVSGTAAGSCAFTGTEATIEVEGTAAGTAAFTGTQATLEVSGTAAGTAAFTGTQATLEVSGTAAGTAAFTGTPATITVS